MEVFFGSTNPLLSGSEVRGENNDTTRSLFQFSLILQSKLLLWLLAVSGLLFVIGLVLNLVEVLKIAKQKYGQNAQKMASRERLKRISRTTNWSSTALALAATVGITQATCSLQFMSDAFPSSINVERGTASQALHWLVVSFSFIITVGKTIVRPRKGAVKSGASGAPAVGAAPSPPAGAGGGGGPVIV